jgi:hypothetical protein
MCNFGFYGVATSCVENVPTFLANGAVATFTSHKKRRKRISLMVCITVI